MGFLCKQIFFDELSRKSLWKWTDSKNKNKKFDFISNVSGNWKQALTKEKACKRRIGSGSSKEKLERIKRVKLP